MKKIGIIGANSYIARNLICCLKKSDYLLKLYDKSNSQADGESNYTMIDILSKESVSKIDFSCDVMFVFVGKTGSINGFDDYESFININELALLNILNECRRQKSKAKIIFPSTRLVYKGKKGKLVEDSEKEFKTVYAINKYACEKYLEQYHKIYGINYCIFRICVPYGTMVQNASSIGTAEFMLNKAQKNSDITIYGDGSIKRTITSIDDLCFTLIKGALSDKCLNDIFNIGGEEYSLNEMACLISKKYNVKVKYVDWPELALKIETGDTVFDDSKLKDAIGDTVKHRFTDWINN